jgi:putative ABC transport system permease protein
MRTFLTMLGVVIGVASVIMIFSAGNAGKAYINGLFDKLGNGIINISLADLNNSVESDLFTMRDVEVIQKNIPEVLQVQYYGTKMTSKINYDKEVKNLQVLGVTPKIFGSRPITLEKGRLLNEVDLDNASSVGVMYESSAKDLFGNFNPIGKKVTIQDEVYGSKIITIIGVIGVDMGGDITEMMMDNSPVMMMIPFTTYQSYYNIDTLDMMEVSIPSDADTKSIAQRIRTVLELLHNNKDKYILTSSQDIKDTLNTVINVIQTAILAIGAISLLVGGIGIMNIMLVAVTERTREIGIRKAIGAQKRHIIIQFLMEAILLTLLSGIVGIIIGILPVFPLAGIANCTPAELVSPGVILVAISVSVLCGVFFGVYPAKKAANLDPIESLRYE